MNEKENVRLDQQQTNAQCIAVLMAVSRESGVDLVKVYDKSIDKKKFLEFLQELRDKYYFQDIMLHMD